MINYSNIRMLQNVNAKSINLFLHTNDIDSQFRTELFNVINKCTGKTELYITLFSDFDDKGIKLVSRNNAVDINDTDFSDFIAAYPNIIKKVIIKQ